MAARVAHVVPTDRIAYLLLRRRLKRLAEAGYEIHLLCGRAPDSGAPGGVDYEAAFAGLGVRVHYQTFEREISPAADARCAAELFFAVRRGGYDIVHSHNPKGGLLGPPVARVAGAPHVLHTVHGFLFHDRTRGLRRAEAVAAERWTARWCHHLLFQVVEDLEYARAHRFKAAERLHLVGNGVDESYFDPAADPEAGARRREELGWEEDHLVVGTTGRLVREKGYEEFFEMAGRIARQREDVRFLVVGLFEPEQSDAVDPVELARAHGVADRCVVLQGRDDMPALYAAMDLFVLASHREGLSRSLMEAAAMARPAVACDIRGCREIVVDGVTGRLAPVRDAAALAEAVGGLLDDAPARRQMGRAGRERVAARYTEDLVARRVIDCYRRILEA